MRIMAIFTRDVARRIDHILGRIMHASGHLNRMHARLVELGGEVLGRYISAVAGETILLIGREIQ